MQLANPSFKLPDGGKNFKIYVETEGDTDNFYIDEAIGAVKGTAIEGPPVVTTTTTTTTTTKATTTKATTTTTKATTATSASATTTATTTEITEKPPVNTGDINADGKVNLADVVLLQKWLLGIPETKLADWQAGDLYTDGVLNGFDLCLLRHTVTSSGNV